MRSPETSLKNAIVRPTATILVAVNVRHLVAKYNRHKKFFKKIEPSPW